MTNLFIMVGQSLKFLIREFSAHLLFRSFLVIKGYIIHKLLYCIKNSCNFIHKKFDYFFDTTIEAQFSSFESFPLVRKFMKLLIFLIIFD
jgi:hypothetical protein